MADLAVADMVRAARGFYAKQRVTRLADDAAAQEKWLSREARARGFKDIDDLADRAYPVFEKLAELWRQRNPASALMSRGVGRIPMVSARTQLEQDIARATADLARAVAAGRATTPVLIGRTPHVLSALAGVVTSAHPNPVPFLIDETVTNKVWFGAKHASEMVGVTPAMLVRAMYRPAAVVADRAQAGNVSLVTNILTPLGPVVVSVNTKADWRGEPVAMVVSAYPRQRGEVADWIRGTVAGRDVLYVDEQQIGEAVTGNLNPENGDATRKGWRLVSYKGEITGLGHSAGGPPSPISDKAIVSNWAAPVNANYRGLATIKDALQKRLTGIGGLPKAKTYADLLRWIDKHYKGEAGDKPLFSRATPAAAAAPPSTPAQRAETIIQNAAGTPKPLDTIARTLTRVSGLERLTAATYGLGARLIERLVPETVKAGVPAGRYAGERHRERPVVSGDVRSAPSQQQPAGRDLKPKSGLNYRFTDDRSPTKSQVFSTARARANPAAPWARLARQ